MQSERASRPRAPSSWLVAQNLRRAAERLARGAKRRTSRGGEGQALGKAAWSRRRSFQRTMARMRKLRRPFVQGKRRLWGKGPAPLCYCVDHAPAGSSTDALGDISPSSACSHEACAGTPLGDDLFLVESIAPETESVMGDECFTPSVMAFLDEDVGLQRLRSSCNPEHCSFRSLASAVGVRV